MPKLNVANIIKWCLSKMCPTANVHMLLVNIKVSQSSSILWQENLFAAGVILKAAVVAST